MVINGKFDISIVFSSLYLDFELLKHLWDLVTTYFSVSKLWFTLRASASAVAPESPILFGKRSPIIFSPRLWKRVHQNLYKGSYRIVH